MKHGQQLLFTDCIKKLLRYHTFGRFRLSLIQTWHDRYYCTLPFDSCLIDLDLNSRSKECQKVKTSAPIISQGLQWI